MTYGEYCTLVDELNELAKAYSNGNSPVSDVVYDTKYRQLKEYELQNPDLILPESPTQKVVEELVDGFKKVAHTVPMGSILNANGIDEACEWVRSMKEEYGVKMIELTFKLDGASLALTYNNGLIDDAVTRGQDNVGDSVLNNAVQIDGVRTNIKRQGKVEVRGEVLWPFDSFDEFNESLEDAGKKPMANPRNGAAGSLKLSSPKEVAARKLMFVAYIVAQGSESDTQTGDVDFLESEGFYVPERHTIDISGDDGIEKFRETAEAMRNKRYELPYAIDGVVIKVDDKSLHDSIGRTEKAPLFYRAYKFPPEEKDTLLLDIEQSVGGSGAITPVAIVEPVSLAMTTVQRCTLHNWDLVEYLGLFKGCHVRIRKAGEIIPELVMCVETGVSKDDYEILVKGKNSTVPKYYDMPMSKRLITNKDFYKRPSVCPFCGHELDNQVNAEGKKLVSWVCSNPDCEAQIIEKLCNFASRTVMNIRGMGPSIIEDLFVAKKLTTIDGFYTLTREDLMECCGCREKKADKLIAAIDATRGNYLHQLIEGFGIPGLGHTASPIAARCVNAAGGLQQLLRNDQEGTESIDMFDREAHASGLSALLADKLIGFIKNHSDIVSNFVKMGVAQTYKDDGPVSDKLAGKVCIMTGVFEELERDVFKEMVVKNGGKVCSGITKKTNIVLMGEGAGPSKVKTINDLKASGVDIKVYTPETLKDFLALVQ